MYRKLLNWIDQQQISVPGGLAALGGVFLIRCLLEAFSNPSASGIIASDTPTLVHYALSYLSVLAGLACIGARYSGDVKRVWKILIFGFPIIWLGPFLDIVINGGAGKRISYFFHPPLALGIDFFLFLTPWSIVTSGLKIEMAIIIAVVGLYVWLDHKQIRVALKGSLEAYAWLFFIFALPSFVYTLAHLSSPAELFDFRSSPVIDYFKQSLAASALSENSLHASFSFSSPMRSFEIGFDYLMAQIYYIMLCAFSAWGLWRVYPEQFGSIIKNSRPERVGFYLLFLVLGMLLATERGLVPGFTWIDGISALTLMISWYCAWMYAIHVNDIADQPIDVITNSGRPLARQSVSLKDMRCAGYIWLVFSGVGAWAVGYYPFFFCLVFTACYYVYSAPPLRLKRVPILSSALIAGAILCTLLAGFFFISNDKKFLSFPMQLVAGLVLIFTLGVNVRDIKDIEGDRAHGILTLPVLFGRHGTKVVGVLFALGFLLAPAVLRAPHLIIPAIPATVAAYVIAVQKPFQEKWVFLLYFCFIAVSVSLFFFFPACQESSLLNCPL